MELKNKTAIITGSARGIGAGIAVVFAREGANVVVNGLDTASCEQVVKEITSQGGKAIGVGADVSKKDQVQAMVAKTIAEFGTVDILVNNAGIEAPPCLMKNLSEEQRDRMLVINLKGVFGRNGEAQHET